MPQNALNLLTGEYDLDDIVAAIVALTPKKCGYFTGDTILIHETFFEMRKKFPMLKNRLAFTTNRVRPLSPELEDSLSVLETSRIVGMENPDYTRYIIKSNGRKFVQSRILPMFSKGEVTNLTKMAKYFAKKCGPKSIAN